MDLLTGNRYEVRSFDIAAGYAGWLLARLGADVTHETRLDPEGMGAYLANGGVFTDSPSLEVQPGRTLITDAPVTDEHRARIDGLAERGRVIWLTPWGSRGAWSERPATDLTLYGASGWMVGVGEPDREPLGPPGAQGQYMGGLYAAIAALAPVVDERGGGATGLVDIAMVEALAATTIYDAVAFQYHERLRQRVGNRYSPAQPTIATFPCKDGYIGIHAALHQQWVSLANLTGHPELVDDPRFRSHLERAQHIAELDGYLLPWLAKRSRWDAYRELQRNRIPSSPIPDVAEVLASEHLRARDAWQKVETPGGRRFEAPHVLARAREADSGQQTAEASREKVEMSPWKPGRLRVVDLSMGWAGPMVGYILSSLGADVIKIESHTHFDWWRGSRPPGSDPALSPHERSHVFNSVNRGKRGITLNLATPQGNKLARQLIAGADVVVENFGAGVIEKLGLTYETLSRDNPALVMLRQPGFGSDGPEANYVTFGNTIEGNAGLTSLTGYADGPPVILNNALGDPVSGLTGSAAVLAALAARDRTGHGYQLECAQIEGFLPVVSEALISYQVTGEIPQRKGNVRPGHTPSGAFPCAGDDAWVVLEVRSDDEWATLAEAIGETRALEPRFAEQAGREQHREELWALLAAWTGERSREEVVATCLGAGVPASIVSNEADELALEPLVERGFWVGQEREMTGFHLYPTVPIVTRGERAEPGTPAPLLGQHTAEVLAGLGVSQQDFATLAAEGVTGLDPLI